VVRHKGIRLQFDSVDKKLNTELALLFRKNCFFKLIKKDYQKTFFLFVLLISKFSEITGKKQSSDQIWVQYFFKIINLILKYQIPYEQLHLTFEKIEKSKH
jgi:hypothetical protein